MDKTNFNMDTIISNKKVYQKIEGKIKLGDLFYLPLMDKIYINDDKYIDPNDIGAIRVQEIKSGGYIL